MTQQRAGRNVVWQATVAKAKVSQVTEASFEQEVLRSELPVLVDLYADWCQPCKLIEPILDELARELSGKLKIVRVDVEKSPRLAQGFRVQSIPMLVLFADGRPVDQVVGAVNKQALVEMVKPVLPASEAEIVPKDLDRLAREGRVLAVDLRDATSFRRYRIPGAINIPSEQVTDRARELRPSDGRLRVLYSRSGEEAKELADKLRERGINVGFLAGGFLHWEADGLGVERG